MAPGRTAAASDESWLAPPILLTSDRCQNDSFDREGDGHLLASSSVQRPPSAFSTYNDYLGYAQTTRMMRSGGAMRSPATVPRRSVRIRTWMTKSPNTTARGTLWQDNVFDPHDRAPVAEILTPADRDSTNQHGAVRRGRPDTTCWQVCPAATLPQSWPRSGHTPR